MSSIIGIYEGLRVHIKEYDKKTMNKQIKCIGCDAKLIAKCGNVYIHHFAHKRDNNCDFLQAHDSKTQWHMNWQNIVKNDCIEKEF